MENFFNLSELDTQNAFINYFNKEIDEIFEIFCEDTHLMDLIRVDGDPLYTVTSDVTKENKKFKCDERTIKL